jgi:amiloride-sensitive sodium channel subunit alpha/amiloride-sensitive sodium channel subunit gamma
LQFGNCYSFNKGVYNNGSEYKIKKVGFAGPTYGLSLEIFLGNPPIDTINEYRDGLYVSINNQSTIPFTQGDIITAPAGVKQILS